MRGVVVFVQHIFGIFSALIVALLSCVAKHVCAERFFGSRRDIYSFLYSILAPTWAI